MSLGCHPWLFLTPRTEAQAEVEMQKGCHGPPSLLWEGRPPPALRPQVAPLLAEQESRQASDGQEQVPHLASWANSSAALCPLSPGWPEPLLGTTTDTPPVPISHCTRTCLRMRPAHVYEPGLVLVRRTQHRARDRGVLVL